MGSKQENFSRFGIATKGIVYVLVGVAAAFVALGANIDKLNISGGLYFIQSLFLGKLLLTIISIGLIAYGFWLGVKTFTKKQYATHKLADIAIRIGYVSGIIVYLTFAYSAILILFNSKDTKRESIEVYEKLTQTPFVKVFMIIVGIAFILKACNQFYLAISENYRKEIDESRMKSTAIKWITRTGKIGYAARGIVILVTGYLFIKAGINHNYKEIEQKDAFNWLDYELGGFLMGVIALGFALYGVFFLVKGYYADVDR